MTPLAEVRGNPPGRGTEPPDITFHVSHFTTHQLGTEPYEPTWQAMRALTATRGPETPDQLWLLQHQPVYTLGLAGKAEHLLESSAVPVVKIDRGGQITYHGPGQAMVYVLVDLTRRNLKVRELVRLMEQAIIDALQDWGIVGERRDGAPGVYVQDALGEAKIAALGLKISRGCSYHGLALNVDMDLTPFLRINPCGYEGLRTTQLIDQGVRVSVEEAQQVLASHMAALLEQHYPLQSAAQLAAQPEA